MTGSDPWRRLFELPHHGTGIALPRLAALARPALESDWARGHVALRVTGSNGKGSVATYAAEILRALGLGTGLFTSPHLLHPSERIRVDGAPVSDDQVAGPVERFFERRAEYLASHPDEETGSFEALTAVALDVFQEADVQAAVYEAGLGGRLDPTRLVPGFDGGKAVALTSLDLEHTSLLGPTLEHIAYEKADLCPDGGVLVVGPIPSAIGEKLAAYCRLRNIRPLFTERVARIEIGQPRDDGEPGTRFDLGWTEDLGLPELTGLEIRLPGPHQPWNAAVAILLVATALREAKREVAPETLLAEAIRHGLARATIPARFQRLRQHPDLYTDIAHTPAAAHATARTAQSLRGDRPVILVLAVSDDKKVEEIVHELVTSLDPERDHLLVSRARHHAASPDRLLRAAQAAGWTGETQTHPTADTALPAALDRAGPDGLLLVAGSLYLAAETAALLQGTDPDRLRFF